MENMAKAHRWDEPAPEGVLAAHDRMARVKANMARLGKRGTRDAIPSGAKTAYDIEMSGDEVHERSAKQGGGVTNDPKAFAKMQSSIENIGDKVSLHQVAKEMGIPLNPTGKKPTSKKGKK